jgi:hypothetical protein
MPVPGVDRWAGCYLNRMDMAVVEACLTKYVVDMTGVVLTGARCLCEKVAMPAVKRGKAANNMGMRLIRHI